jgi:AraC-like DNA-binding protein
MQKEEKTMQFESIIKIFDTVEFSSDKPVMPIGELFVYHPSFSPEALHYHNFLEIGYCEHGSGVFIVDGEIVPFDGKCASIIYEGQTHIAQSINPRKSLWHFLYINLEYLYSGHNSWGLSLINKTQHELYEFRNILFYDESPPIYELVKQILEESSTIKENYLDVIRGLVYALLLEHSRFNTRRRESAQDTKHTKLLDEIAESINYINMNYMYDINISKLVKISHTSKASLQRKFLSVTGMSPMQYLHYMRLNRAAVMLSNEKKPIIDIAQAVGYNSLSGFNRHFLKHFNMSPSTWRKMKKKPDPVSKIIEASAAQDAGPKHT